MKLPCSRPHGKQCVAAEFSLGNTSCSSLTYHPNTPATLSKNALPPLFNRMTISLTLADHSKPLHDLSHGRLSQALRFQRADYSYS